LKYTRHERTAIVLGFHPKLDLALIGHSVTIANHELLIALRSR
jgi:hypothetical protein